MPVFASKEIFLASRFSFYILEKSKSTRKWIVYSFSPSVHRVGEKLIHKLTSESGSGEWTVIKSSNRWNRYIVWTLVSVAGFGITWAMFARIDETVQAPGKLEPLGTTIDIKAPLGGVIKNIMVKEGELVRKDQVLIELDPTAAEARLEALLKVKNRTLIDLKLSKSQLGQAINEDELNNNQKLRLSALKHELQSRIAASQSEVTQSEQQLESSRTVEIQRECFENPRKYTKKYTSIS